MSRGAPAEEYGGSPAAYGYPSAAASPDIDPYPYEEQTMFDAEGGDAEGDAGIGSGMQYDERDIDEYAQAEARPAAYRPLSPRDDDDETIISYVQAPGHQMQQQQWEQQQRQQQQQQQQQRRTMPTRKPANQQQPPQQQQRRPPQQQTARGAAPAPAPFVEEDPFADPNSAPAYAAPVPQVQGRGPQQKQRQQAAGAPRGAGGAAAITYSSAGASSGSASASAHAAPAGRSGASSTRAGAPHEQKGGQGAPSSSSSSSHAVKKKMEDMLRHNMEALEKGGVSVLNAVRGIEDNAEARATVEDEQLASHNYDLMEDHVNRMAVGGGVHGHILTLLQLLLTIMVALMTAIAMYFIHHVVEYCSELRVDTTLELIKLGKPYEAYFALLGCSLFLAGVATCLVTFFAPHARGGGVPYVQAYLNGTNVASYFSLRIVLVKIAALGFTIASGLSLGMEGPFVFIGSGIAIILNKSLEALSFGNRVWGRYARILKNINEERVFMAGGMAAGLAVAFNAPIAGVLMALEGSTAFLTVPVVLRIFGCAMFASFFNDLGHANFSRNIKTHNIISINPQVDAPPYLWVLWEIFAFAGVAVLGGCIGALAIWINVKVTKWRHHAIEPQPPHNRLNTLLAVGEVLVMCFFTATAWFVLPYVFGCRQQHEQCFPTISVPERCLPVQCPDKFYSEIGTIVYSSSDGIARILFDRTLLSANDISPGPLLVYGAFYMCFVAIMYGAHVPGGLFVPALVVGGCMGRVFGNVLHVYVSSTVNPGVYALLGAASMFGGFTRIALPAVVMLTEMTGDATYLLPIMFCTVVAKVVSDELSPALYPQHMAIEGIPTLGDKLNPLIAPLQAQHIMQRSFYSVRQIDTLERILEVLDRSRSMLLPVVSADGSGKFMGMIMRRSVIYALKYTKLYKDLAEFADDQCATIDELEVATVIGGAGTQQRRSNSSMLEVERKMGGHRDTSDYSASIERFDDKFATYLVNLAPFMDAGTLTAHEETSAKRIAAIFRRLGISHLGVSDSTNTLVGIITRRHLIKPPAALPPAPMVPVQRSGADDLDASPEAVLELAAYDEARQTERHSSGGSGGMGQMDPFQLNQNLAARFRHSSSILGADPAVRFDDDEDFPEDAPFDDDRLHADVDDAQLYDVDAPDDLNNTGASARSTRSTRSNASMRSRSSKQESSLSRLNKYTSQLE